MRRLVQRNSDDNDDKRCQQQQKVFFDLHRQPSFNLFLVLSPGEKNSNLACQDIWCFCW